MAAQTATITEQILHPATSQAPQYDFTFSDYLKREFNFGIGTDRPVCKAFLQGHCPLGHACPDKHPAQASFNSLVCKHWMRALCKKGEHCEFLHEYNLRKMPECHTFVRHGTCPNGDDCMYQHLDAASRRPVCPHYERGFCPLGPICAKKHVRKTKICPLYMAGFCPNGPDCMDGAHARFPIDLKKPTVRGQEPAAEVEDDAMAVDQDYGQRFNQGQRFGQDWRGKKTRGTFKPLGR